jgi:protein required for attachment to host cells
MSTTWIVVANASQARVFANHGPKKGLSLLKEFSHPESREKALQLVSDRPGHNQSHGNGHGSYVPASDPKQQEADRFALQIAKELELGRSSNGYEKLIVVASPSFLGLLNSKLSNHVRSRVTQSIEKDYTRATERELTGHLEHCIYL